MKTIEKKYINLTDDLSKEIFQKHGIEMPAHYTFSDINIVIGPNGSGKTRFLRAVREIYQKDGNNKIIYGYFPCISHSREAIIPSNELPPATLYEFLQESELEFEDFLREIELHNEEYIPQLLIYHSRLQKDRGEKAMKTLQHTFSAISDQEIIIENDELCLRDRNNKVSSLTNAILRFSPGELIIFYMSVFLSLQKNSNKRRVIILDEPECHLHPKALIQFVKLIKESNYYTSIWIATHSLFLVPEFEFQNIIYVNKSKVMPRSSSTYQSIVDELLGKDNDKTSEFISSLPKWQYSEYIAECFTDPDVIETINPEDEQVKLFIEFLKSHKSIRILDYGGGSARLGLSLKESNHKPTYDIVYEILDPKPKYTGKEFVIHKSVQSIRQKYDCIVMMNVLHEISPKEWKNMFKVISNILNEYSYLLFVETSVLTKGERPNYYGYLVLDSEELRVLFSCPNPFQTIVIKEGQKSVCTIIPKNVLYNITDSSIIHTIDLLENRTLQKIKEERNKEGFITSRYYAFLAQQYINAKITGEMLRNEVAITNGNVFFTENIHDGVIVNDLNNEIVNRVPSKSPSSKDIELVIKVLNKKSRVELMKIARDTLRRIALSEHNQTVIKACDIALVLLKNTRTRIYNQEHLDAIWYAVLQMEKTHELKNKIALFLICLYLFGDQRSVKRISNNGYLFYVQKIIDNLV